MHRMIGDAPNQTVYETHGGTMAFAIAAILNGNSAVVSEQDMIQLEGGTMRLKVELRKRLDDRANLILNVPMKHMLVHADDVDKAPCEARFLPSISLLFGNESDGLASLRSQLQPLKVFYCFILFIW